MNAENELILCECNNLEHQLVFSYFPDDEDYKYIYVSVNLIPERNIFKRIWCAIKYIFGYKSKYGPFDEFIIGQRDSHKLVKILKYLDPKSIVPMD